MAAEVRGRLLRVAVVMAWSLSAARAGRIQRRARALDAPSRMIHHPSRRSLESSARTDAGRHPRAAASWRVASPCDLQAARSGAGDA